MEIEKANNNLPSPMHQAIFYAMELTGFKPKNSTKQEIDFLIGFIQRSFNNLSIEDFRKAFELAVAGQLDYDANNYQNFNTLYVSNIIQSYKRYKISNKVKDSFANNFKELQNPNPTSSEEQERAFYWVNFNFMDESERNGEKGHFPDLIMCSWKDAYRHMLSKGMIKELEGKELQERIKEIELQVKSDNKNPKKRMSNSVDIGLKKKEMIFYKYEVMDYFILNREKLIYN